MTFSSLLIREAYQEDSLVNAHMEASMEASLN
jgi:hypothetical protein